MEKKLNEVINHRGGTKKLGSVLYLRAVFEEQILGLKKEMLRLWPQITFEIMPSGSSFFIATLEKRSFALEVKTMPVPGSLTQYVAGDVRNWPSAERDLGEHRAHISVATTYEDHVDLELASDFTKLL